MTRCDHGGAPCPRIHRQAVPIEEEERWQLVAALPFVALSAFFALVGTYLFLVALASMGRV